MEVKLKGGIEGFSQVRNLESPHSRLKFNSYRLKLGEMSHKWHMFDVKVFTNTSELFSKRSLHLL